MLNFHKGIGRTLFTNSVTVNTTFDNRRLQYDVGIGYSDDIDIAKQLILEAMHSVNEVLQDPAPDVLVMDLAESTVNIRARWWINPPRRIDDLASRDRVLCAIKKKLTENGIDLPYPTRQILFHDPTEETDGDRSLQREGWTAGKREFPRSGNISNSIRELAQVQTQQNDHSQETHNKQ